MQGPGRPDIVNAGSWETRYSECRVRGDQIYWMQGPGRPDIVNAGISVCCYLVVFSPSVQICQHSVRLQSPI
ncbi:unnamed protein product [Staurois parvus]|uniref:Uncharacterized protein n=1 Tax=Staurois parvus TaxID=386267 RepID=A0ABN9AY52_9NEOB|nr:unnamed protein product [Staurois parvus]